MVRPTIQIGHPALKSSNTQIEDFNSDLVKNLIQDLKDSMYEAGLIGIAAPQIAENYTIFVTEPRETPARPKDQTDTFRVFINPVIVNVSDEKTTLYEGCGSVLNGTLFGPVRRPKVVTVEAYDEYGKKFRFTADGILGRVIQHEYDHLRGIEFTEIVEDYRKLMHVDFYIQNIRNSKEQMEASIITQKKCILLN